MEDFTTRVWLPAIDALEDKLRAAERELRDTRTALHILRNERDKPCPAEDSHRDTR